MPSLPWIPSLAIAGVPSSHDPPSAIPALFSNSSEFASVQSQWGNPNDILSLLMIIGGEVVQRAVAQLAGHTSFFVPAAFSFGWVGYSMNAVLFAIGEGRLMPVADCPSILVDARNGFAKTNQSWVLGRLVRDYRSTTEDSGLTVTFFRALPVTKRTRPGVPHRDWLYWSGVVVMMVQLGISVIPVTLKGDWNTLIVTLAGTLLALAGGAQPQWPKEKWACRKTNPADRKARTVVCLTRGNGSKDVMVIITEGGGQLRLEDLANMRDPRARYTIVLTSILAVLWFVLLLTVAGLQSNAWYLLAIGSLGMVQNYIVAGCRRDPGAFGIHLKREGWFHANKVFKALQSAEVLERGVGLSLLPVFFPGGLRDDEEAWRDKLQEIYAEADRKKVKVKDTQVHAHAYPPVEATIKTGS